MWLNAIRAGFFATWPMLTTKAVEKYFLESEETQKEHMQQQWQGVQLTKEQDDRTNMHTVHSTQFRTRDIHVKKKDMKQLMYTDKTGQIPVVSSQGNRYIMVLCNISYSGGATDKQDIGRDVQFI